MNIGVISCLMLGALFGILGIVFALLKAKGAMLISGFNTLSKAERETYDQIAMSKDMRNSLLLWVIIFGIGAILSYFLSPYMALAAFGLWLILLLRDVHFDTKKAFAKYKL